jgi:hypothetical protein
MAGALVVMALGQLVLAIMGARMARQATDAVQEVRRDLRPILEKAQKIANDGARTSEIVRSQAERIDQIIALTAQRIDETLTNVQAAVSGPLRQGSAVVAGIRAAMEVLRSVSERRRGGARAREEDEDALFVG